MTKNEKKVLYHGSPYDFDQFNLDKVGENGTAQGRGIYLSPNKDLADMYASWKSRPKSATLYEVQVKLDKPLSTDKMTVTKEQLSKIISKLDDQYGLLSSINDVDYFGRDAVKSEAMDLFSQNENDVDLINDLGSTLGDFKNTAKVFEEVGGYTHIVSENQTRMDDTVITVLNPDNLKILSKEEIDPYEMSLELRDTDLYNDLTNQIASISPNPDKDSYLKSTEKMMAATDKLDETAIKSLPYDSSMAVAKNISGRKKFKQSNSIEDTLGKDYDPNDPQLTGNNKKLAYKVTIKDMLKDFKSRIYDNQIDFSQTEKKLAVHPSRDNEQEME